MRTLGLPVTDPTIPGLSVRDLTGRAADAMQTFLNGATPAVRHRDYLIRHDLAHLDVEALQDIGLDRDRS